jgi:hypothetical protein
VVKLAFTVCSLGLLVLAGKRLFPGVMQVSVLSFTVAVLLGTLGILSLGFVIASLVPTARFAQPIGAVVLYPMLVVSGLFFRSASYLPRCGRSPTCFRRHTPSHCFKACGTDRAGAHTGSTPRRCSRSSSRIARSRRESFAGE